MSVFLAIVISDGWGLTHNKPLLVELVHAGNENVGKLRSWSTILVQTEISYRCIPMKFCIEL